jgi:hypothetical protein
LDRVLAYYKTGHVPPLAVEDVRAALFTAGNQGARFFVKVHRLRLSAARVVDRFVNGPAILPPPIPWTANPVPSRRSRSSTR